MADDQTQAPAPAANVGPSASTSAPAPVPSSGDAALQSASQEVTQQHTSLPAPMPKQPMKIDRASGLLGMLTMAITNSVAAHKEEKIQNAMGNYMSYANAHTRAEDIVNKSGVTDPQKRQQMMTQLVQADPSVKAIFSGQQGQKNVKAMKDLLKVDFTDPESMNTIQHQALQRVTKAIGMQKVMAMLGTLRQQHQQQSQGVQGGQPQQQGPTPEQQQQSYQRTVGRAESQATPLPTDVKGATEIANAQANLTKANADLTKAQTDAKNKFQTKVTANGDLLAFDTSTGKAVPLTDAAGNQITGQTKVGAGEGKVAMVDTVPIGITHAGPDGKPRVITPEMPEWTPQDAKVFSVAKAASEAHQQSQVDLAQKRYEFLLNRPQAVLVTQDDPQRGLKAGQLAFVTQKEAGATPGKFAPVAAGDKAMATQARFGEIQAAMDGVTKAIDGLGDQGFDTKTRAQLAAVMRSPDPNSAISTFMNSEAATTLSGPQAEYVQWLASLSESALNLATLSGQRGGSDKVRNAISNMLPGPGTPSAKYAKGQLSKLQTEYNALIKGVPSLGALDTTTGGGKTDNSGTISFTANGKTYNIPKDQVAAFKKDFPNATTVK